MDFGIYSMENRKPSGERPEIFYILLFNIYKKFLVKFVVQRDLVTNRPGQMNKSNFNWDLEVRKSRKLGNPPTLPPSPPPAEGET
jgi:hypothetical protein